MLDKETYFKSVHSIRVGDVVKEMSNIVAGWTLDMTKILSPSYNDIDIDIDIKQIFFI